MSGDNGDAIYLLPPRHQLSNTGRAAIKNKMAKMYCYTQALDSALQLFFFKKRKDEKVKIKKKGKRGWKKRSPPLSLFWRPKVPPAHNVFSKKPAPKPPGFFVVVRVFGSEL